MRLLTFFILAFTFQILNAQSIDVTKYRADSLGSISNNLGGTMDGNNIRTIFYNYGMIGYWPFSPSLEWPKGKAVNYLDGMTLVAAGSVVAPKLSAPNNKVQIIETNYREEMDATTSIPTSPINQEPWGFNPVGRYASYKVSEFGDPTIAVSNVPGSWPDEWPDVLGLPDSLNGTFFSGVYPFSLKPSLESFWVMDDSKDAEFTFPTRGGFYPIEKNSPDSPMDIYEGWVIPTTDTVNFPGGFKPDNSKQWYNPAVRKGLGLRAECRLIQWKTPGLEDMLIGVYDLFNLSDFDYSEFTAGFFIDSGIGGDPDVGDDYAGNMGPLPAIRFWDHDGKTPANLQLQLGMFAVLLLETPEEISNSLDDDGDGLTDESRMDGIDNDGDWDPVTDDTGLDGIPETGDLGEGDGIPSSGEPNFDATDPDESDQSGLGSITFDKLDGKTTRDLWPKNDPVMWSAMATGGIGEGIQNTNFVSVISSGTYHFKKGTRTRISMAIVMAEDSASLVKKMETAQIFYNSGFRYLTKPVGVGQENLPAGFELFPVYPNPFNPSTTVRYFLPQSGTTNLTVYNLLGQPVRVLENGFKPAGNHKVTFDAKDLPSGVYFINLISGSSTATQKVILLK